ncbi:MAG: bifunctional fucokinase/L-fucose-1-P-guanylyltransferase, partial [Bacteroides sp.]|nr:bifunctional fucokinase/L-fucose-1-P-guanylyltransferase [Bacteroides sp.]
MYKLLSLPPNLVADFNEIETTNGQEWFCSSDPIEQKLGSGGGTTWLLQQWMHNRPNMGLGAKKIILHAGGQSRRLPAYAPSGKVLTPIPVFRWARGQHLNQHLLSLQMPLYEKMLQQAPEGLSTLIASGDVYIRAEQPLQAIPQADVVCYGLWVNPELATRHGVFVMDRRAPEVLDFMLQKPSLTELEALSKTHLFLMDIGIWLLSERAVKLLMKRSEGEGANGLRYYDLYSDFGRSLGAHPALNDAELKELSVAILPLPGGEFYHFGTSRELVSSTLAIQNSVYDQRQIMHRKLKPNPAIFVQNAAIDYAFTGANNNIWIENSHVHQAWKLRTAHIITGVPRNDWHLALPDGVCLDIVPLKQGGWAVRPYGYDDAFSGYLASHDTLFLGKAFVHWLAERGISLQAFGTKISDLQAAALFPVVRNVAQMEAVIRWMINEPTLSEGKQLWMEAERLSADEISACADLKALYKQRKQYSKENLTTLADNYERSVFYQLDLEDVAQQYTHFGLPKPALLPDDAP